MNGNSVCVVNWTFVLAVKLAARRDEQGRWQGLLNALKAREPVGQLVFGSEDEAKASPIGQLLAKQRVRPQRGKSVPPMFRPLSEHQADHDKVAAERAERELAEQTKRDEASRAERDRIRLVEEEAAAKREAKRAKREAEMSLLDSFGSSSQDDIPAEETGNFEELWGTFAVGRAAVDQNRFPEELVVDRDRGLVLPILNRSKFVDAGEAQVVQCAISGEEYSLGEMFTYTRAQRDHGGNIIRDSEKRVVKEDVTRPVMQVVWLPCMRDDGSSVYTDRDGNPKKVPVLVTNDVARQLHEIAKRTVRDDTMMLNYQPAIKYFYKLVSSPRPATAGSSVLKSQPRQGRPLRDHERRKRTGRPITESDSDE